MHIYKESIVSDFGRIGINETQSVDLDAITEIKENSN